MSLRYARLLIFWGVAFVISLFLIITGFGSSFSTRDPHSSNGLDKPNAVPDDGDEPEGEETNWNLILGIVTAITSGAGFVATTYFALREDRREAAIHELEIKNLKQEIEQKNLEIERLRRDQERS
ncbi:MAG: hypothetical protein R3293_07735 [Candidatus Promineifilaceae bacterium]|nr:hypothetical protein [Candidatus Promineifilaceae bacterium]